MDMEQVIKQLDWLDNERRRDKDAIASLQEQLQAYQRDVPKLFQRMNDVESEIVQMKTHFERFDQLELQINNLQVEFNRRIKDAEDRFVYDLEASEKRTSAEFAKINIAIGDIKKSLTALSELRADVSTLEKEDNRLGRLIAEVEKSLDVISRGDESKERVVKMLEENRRQDAKRILDLQAESDQFRKRMDEQRGKLELLSENVRKYDGRLTDLKNSEKQRQQEVTMFIEKQSLQMVDQAHEWKQIQEKFDLFATKFTVYEQRMAELSVLSQSLEKSQETYDDVNERLERRIHEITEIQRLSSEQMRQDFVEFQEGDQKRWTTYMIQEEERDKAFNRVVDLIQQRTDSVENATHHLSDLIAAIQDAKLHQTQALIDLLGEDLKEIS